MAKVPIRSRATWWERFTGADDCIATGLRVPNSPRRHCERSEAIHLAAQRKNGLLRCARNDGAGVKHTLAASPRNAPESLINLSPKEGVANAGCPWHPRAERSYRRLHNRGETLPNRRYCRSANQPLALERTWKRCGTYVAVR